MIGALEAISSRITSRVKSLGLRVQFYPLAESVLVRDTESDTTAPVIVDARGECVSVYDVLDSNDVTMYTRLQSISYSESEGFGSGRTYDEESSLSLVVIGKRNHNKHATMSAVVSVLRQFDCVALEQCEVSAQTIWGSEFSGMPYFISPDYYIYRFSFSVLTQGTQSSACN